MPKRLIKAYKELREINRDYLVKYTFGAFGPSTASKFSGD